MNSRFEKDLTSGYGRQTINTEDGINKFMYSKGINTDNICQKKLLFIIENKLKMHFLR